MKSTWRNVVLYFLSLNIMLATSSHLRLPQHAMGTLSTSKNHAMRHLHQRQSQSTSAPYSNSWYTMTTAEAGDSNCLFALLGVDGSVPYPVKFESCDPLQDDALWQFVPDSEGRYYIYNKGWAGMKQRLDINCQPPSLCIEWMGPSGDIYNNQRWFLEQNGDTFRISSLGLPGSVLISTRLGSIYVSLMQNTTTTTIDDNAQNWKLVENSLVSASAALTVAASSTATASPTPTASSTLATISTPTTAAASYSSSSTTIATTATTATPQSTNLVSAISTASTFSTTIVSTSSLASASGPSSSPGNSTSQPAQNALTVGDKAGAISACCALIMLAIALFALPASLLRLITCGRYPKPSINNQQMRASIRISLRT